MDQAVGDIIRIAKEKRPLDDTMFLFTSDNGPEGTLVFWYMFATRQLTNTTI